MMECFGIPLAWAEIRGGREYPQLRGRMKLYAHRNGTLVQVRMEHLPESADSFFALHIHEGGSCQGDGFANTGGHYNPRNTAHPRHAGDLPPLLSCKGSAYLAFVTDRFRIDDVLGKTVVIHSGPDDFTTQPSGNAGQKIACGVIQMR